MVKNDKWTKCSRYLIRLLRSCFIGINRFLWFGLKSRKGTLFQPFLVKTRLGLATVITSLYTHCMREKDDCHSEDKITCQRTLPIVFKRFNWVLSWFKKSWSTKNASPPIKREKSSQPKTVDTNRTRCKSKCIIFVSHLHVSGIELTDELGRCLWLSFFAFTGSSETFYILLVAYWLYQHDVSELLGTSLWKRG